MLKSVICTFCGFNFSFCNQLPDFRGLNICQDWVKFSYLWMSVFLHFCVYFEKKNTRPVYTTVGSQRYIQKDYQIFLGILYHQDSPTTLLWRFPDLTHSQAPLLSSPTTSTGALESPTLDHKILCIRSLLQAFVLPPCCN